MSALRSRPALSVLLVLNLPVLLGQLWPEGAPPFDTVGRGEPSAPDGSVASVTPSQRGFPSLATEPSSLSVAAASPFARVVNIAFLALTLAVSVARLVGEKPAPGTA